MYRPVCEVATYKGPNDLNDYPQSPGSTVSSSVIDVISGTNELVSISYVSTITTKAR